jgi:hypothetical protein
LGYPFAVAALDDNSVAYTDVRGSAVRYLDWYAAAPQVLAGIDVADGAATGAGYHDGRGDVARFDEPMGIAIGTSGTITVAASGSRRIRIIDNLDRKHEVGILNVLPTPAPPSPGKYRVAFIGDSNVWMYVRWSDSLPGIVENGLADDLRHASRTLEVSAGLARSRQLSHTTMRGKTPVRRSSVLTVKVPGDKREDRIALREVARG